MARIADVWAKQNAAYEWAHKNMLKGSSTRRIRAMRFQIWYNESPYAPQRGGSLQVHMKTAWSKYQDEMARITTGSPNPAIDRGRSWS